MSTTTDPGMTFGSHVLSDVVFGREEIARRVETLGREITDHYRRRFGEAGAEGAGNRTGSPSGGLLVLSVLKGSFVFLADLVRAVELPLQVDFVVASSYGDSTVSRGEVDLLYEPVVDWKARDVLLVEDIVDSGTTLDRLVPLLERGGARSVEVCALLRKDPGDRAEEAARRPRWVGFSAPDEFLVGYGLDYSENFRHLPYIASLKEPVPPKSQ